MTLGFSSYAGQNAGRSHQYKGCGVGREAWRPKAAQGMCRAPGPRHMRVVCDYSAATGRVSTETKVLPARPTENFTLPVAVANRV
jgi:hypothetical protein